MGIIPYLTLFRAPLAVATTASAATGWLLASPSIAPGLAAVSCGVLFLSCGASALNQYQERDIDGLMDRTRRRPLPAGKLTALPALAAAFTLLALGLLLLALASRTAAVIGLAALLWYNGLYTDLKRRTAFAAVLGAPVGMAPPAMGWLAGGGPADDPRLAVLCAFFFLWQVPHFWLLLLRDAGEQERAGLPSLAQVFPPERLRRIAVVWSAAAAALILLLPLFGMVRQTFLLPALLSVAALFGATMLQLMRRNTASAFRMNIVCVAAVMAVLSLDAALRM